MTTFVFSRTLRQHEYPKVTVVAEKLEETVAALRAEPGKDIWLFGGGILFRCLLDAGLVDTVEVAVMPVLLGGGVPLFPPPAKPAKLSLTGQKVYPKTGIVLLEYATELIAPKPSAAAAPGRDVRSRDSKAARRGRGTERGRPSVT